MSTGYTLDEYQRDAQRTASEANDTKAVAVSALGLLGEAGEVADLIKKHIGHGHMLDEDRIRDELGDVLWYVANIAKLRKRYPDGFSEERSRNRGAK